MSSVLVVLVCIVTVYFYMGWIGGAVYENIKISEKSPDILIGQSKIQRKGENLNI